MNKIYITLNNDSSILFTCNKPFHPIYGLGKTEVELLKDGYFVENIPTPPFIEGKDGRVYFNPQTLEFSFKYIDKPKEEIDILKEELATQKQSILELSMLIGGGAGV